MQRTTASIALLSAALLSAAASSAHAAAKDDVKAAVQKLADAPSYAFTTTTEGGMAANGGGKVEKGGYTSLEMTLRDNTLKAVKKGDKVAIETDEGWKTPAEMADAPPPQRMAANMVRTYKTPAENAEQYLSDAGDVTKGADGTYTAEMPEAAAKKLLTPNRGGRRGGGAGGGGGGAAGAAGAGPQVSGAKATVTFTLADGSLTKMQVHMSGTVSMGGNDRDVDRTTTTEFKDVGSAKADVPAEAKSKLDAAATTKPA